jgi:hypothetical protein
VTGYSIKFLSFRGIEFGWGLGWEDFGMSWVRVLWIGPIGLKLWMGDSPDPAKGLK